MKNIKDHPRPCKYGTNCYNLDVHHRTQFRHPNNPDVATDTPDFKNDSRKQNNLPSRNHTKCHTHDVEHRTTYVHDDDGDITDEVDVAASPLRKKEKQACKFGSKCNKHDIEHRTAFVHDDDGDITEEVDVVTSPLRKKEKQTCKFGLKCNKHDVEHRTAFVHYDGDDITEEVDVVTSPLRKKEKQTLCSEMLSSRLAPISTSANEIEWTTSEMDAVLFTLTQQEMILSLTSADFNSVVDAILKASDLQNISNFDRVRKLLINGGQSGDATYFIKAYTVDCSFYRILNERLAQRSLKASSDINSDKKQEMLMTAACKQIARVSLLAQTTQNEPRIEPPDYEKTHWYLLYLAPIYSFFEACPKIA
ncbi:unnamed protein product [Rotaria magnacalcarata]|uniref:PBZ-type domain-containing protein n=1 Tax=Rotaria magnacalcarata TaxID=392030 RepID=A0A8S2P4L8_9BILA|nr:unnamed protein product [Rotaria magnacalcarata]